jgi:hypothetical protein
LRIARHRNERRRGRAGLHLANHTKGVGENGATTAASSDSPELLGRYRERGSGRPLSSTIVG